MAVEPASERKYEHEDKDPRGAPRVALLIRAAKITCPEGEFLCVVQDVSETGFSARLFHPLPATDDLVLEMPNEDRHPIELIWESDSRAGFRFREQQEMDRLIASPSPFPKRPLRVKLRIAGELGLGQRRAHATLHNLSQHGARVHTAELLALGQRLTLSMPGLPRIAARVRWRRGEAHGLSFDETFRYADFAETVFRLQRQMRDRNRDGH